MRPWIKVRLPDKEESHLAKAIIEQWRQMREIPRHFAKAIVIYASLREGDVGPLYREFPGLALAAGRQIPAEVRREYKPPAVSTIERSERDELDDALGMFGDVEIE